MNVPEARATLELVRYRNWMPNLGNHQGGVFWFEWSWKENGKEVHGRKWYVSQTSTKSELVQTALLAAIVAEEHEVRKKFLYRGEPIFSPCYNVDLLATFHSETTKEIHG